MRQPALTALDLKQEFGVRSECACRAVPLLYERIISPTSDAAGEAVARDFDAWRLVFGEVAGRDPEDPRWNGDVRFVEYAERLGIDAGECCSLRLMFAVHSYFAVLAKLIVRSVREDAYRGASLGGAADEAVAAFMQSLDDEHAYVSLGVRGFLDGDGFAWCGHIWDGDGIGVARTLLKAMTSLNRAWSISGPAVGMDVLKALYHGLVPRTIRHQLGEYYTPDWLVEHVLDRAGYEGQPDARVLDPACGSGSFLVRAISRLRQRTASISSIVDNIVGIDVNPLAALAARANYWLAIGDLLPEDGEPIELPIYVADSIVSPDVSRDLFSPQVTTRQPPSQRFDFIVGNPPWVGWESLPECYRQRSKPLWIRYGLYPHSGMATILGQGKKDLSILMSYAVSDRWLKDGGRLGFLITQSVFKTSGSGKAFRQFQLAQRNLVPLRVESVDDLSDFQPFEEASTRTAVFVWTRGQPTQYPVPYEIWQKTTPGKKIQQETSRSEVAKITRRLAVAAQPVAPDEADSPWLTVHSDLHPLLRRLLGASDYRAYEGVNTGGANGIYWVDVVERCEDRTWRIRNLTAGAKRKVKTVEAVVESDLLYPLLRGREVRRWQAEPTASILMVQDVTQRRGIDTKTLQGQWPHTWAYLQQFESKLRARAAFRRYFQRKRHGRPVETAPFYSMFDVGPYTLAPFKVVWHRMVTPVEAAVAGGREGKPILPQETHAFVPCESADEAAYLCGMMNSTIFNFAASSYSQIGSKSFASPHILEHIRVPAFHPSSAEHRRVAKLATAIQTEFPRLSGEELSSRQQQLDAAAAAVWQLKDEERKRIVAEYRRLTKADLA